MGYSDHVLMNRHEGTQISVLCQAKKWFLLAKFSLSGGPIILLPPRPVLVALILQIEFEQEEVFVGHKQDIQEFLCSIQTLFVYIIETTYICLL